MKKLSKAVLIFVAGGIFVILAASLGMAYIQQEQEQKQLPQQLSLAQASLTKYLPEELSARQRELESRLAQTESQLRAAKNSLRQSIESIEATDTLFEIAETCDVEITEVNSPGVTTKVLEGFTYSQLSLTVTVEGDVLNLIDFIYEWTHEYPTGVVKSVGITVPEVTEEEEGETGEEPQAEEGETEEEPQAEEGETGEEPQVEEGETEEEPQAEEGETEEEPQVEEEETQKPSANIELSIYTYEGD